MVIHGVSHTAYDAEGLKAHMERQIGHVTPTKGAKLASRLGLFFIHICNSGFTILYFKFASVN